MNRLNNKIAVVTGAARGIGEAIANAFIVEGAFVYLTDINDELGGKVASRLGDHAKYLRLDVREENDWQAVTSKVVKDHGRLDIVVNNAGITGFENGVSVHDPEHVSLENWHEVHRTNLDGVFLGCKYAQTSGGRYYQYFFAIRFGGYPRGGSLCIFKSSCSKSHQDSGTLLRRRETQYSLQFYSSSSYFDPYVGAVIRKRRGSRETNGGVCKRYAPPPLWNP